MRRKLLAALFGFVLGTVALVLIGAADLTGLPTDVAMIRSTAWALMLDDKPLYFGNDSDTSLTFDSTADRLEATGGWAVGANGTTRLDDQVTSCWIWAGATSGTATVEGLTNAGWLVTASPMLTTPTLAFTDVDIGHLVVRLEYGSVDVGVTSTSSWLNLPVAIRATRIW